MISIQRPCPVIKRLAVFFICGICLLQCKTVHNKNYQAFYVEMVMPICQGNNTCDTSMDRYNYFSYKGLNIMELSGYQGEVKVKGEDTVIFEIDPFDRSGGLITDGHIVYKHNERNSKGLYISKKQGLRIVDVDSFLGAHKNLLEVNAAQFYAESELVAADSNNGIYVYKYVSKISKDIPGEKDSTILCFLKKNVHINYSLLDNLERPGMKLTKVLSVQQAIKNAEGKIDIPYNMTSFELGLLHLKKTDYRFIDNCVRMYDSCFKEKAIVPR